MNDQSKYSVPEDSASSGRADDGTNGYESGASDTTGAEPKWRYNGHDPQTLKTAEKFARWGVDWLWYEPRSKNPNTRGGGWQRLPTPSLEEAERVFRSGPRTIGAHLRNKLVDFDIDAPEILRAVETAPERWRLPETMTWGRASNPRSHRLYRLDGQIQKNLQWKDPEVKGEHTKMLEVRVKGQTVAPGSHHETTGEEVGFAPGGCRPLERIVGDELVAKSDRHASVGLCSRYWLDGDRHDMAGPLAGLLYHGGMSQDDALEFVEWVCRAAGDDEIDNRLGYVRNTYQRGDTGGTVAGGPTLVLEDFLTEAQIRELRKWLGLKASGKASADLLGPDGLPLTGNGDGDRFVEMWAGQVLYCAEQDAWYIWDGRRFALDRVNEIRERAKQVVATFRRVLGEKQATCGRDGVAPYRDCSKHSVEMDNPGAITAMLHAARSNRDIRVSLDELDSHPEYLTTLDGTLEFDIKTGHVGFHEHSPEDRMTWLAPVHYDPSATHRLFTQYLDRFFPEADRRTFLGEMAGYVLHGYQKRHALQCIGKHDSGKSTTLMLFAATLGDYAASLTSTNLTKNPHKGGDVGRPDLMRVKYKRLVIVTEVDPDIKFDVALFKAMTGGGDPYAIRTFYDKTGGSDAVFKFALWMSGNRPYGPPPDEEAAFDRLEVLDCTHVVPGVERDAAEEAALTTEQGVLDAAFAFAVEGFRRLYGEKHGALIAPKSSQERKAQLVEELDGWTNVIKQLFEITGNPDDGVLKSSAWEFVRSETRMVRNSYKAQGSFEESLVRRGAKLTHKRERWNNNPYWQGMRWSAYATARYAVDS